jgi:hypothetical protein
MNIIPYRLNEKEYSIFVALGEDSIERIRAYDPGMFDLEKLPEPWPGLMLRQVLIGYATEADMAHVAKMKLDGADMRECLLFLSRGWQFRPDLGDHDGHYERVPG